MAKEQWQTYFDAVRKEDWKTAKNVLQLISKQERNNPQTFVKIGDVCQRTGDKAEAITAYTHAAQLLRMQGFAQKALATYKIALRLDPTNPEIIQRAEMLMDEFEAAKAAPRLSITASIPTPEAEVPAELPLPPAETAPSPVEAPQTSDWLERTAASSGASEDNIVVPELLPSDLSALFESTSLSAEPPRPDEEPSFQVQIPAAPESSAENISTDMTGKQESVLSAEDHAKPPYEDDDWLESAYDALDTRVFKSNTDRPSDTAASGDDDAINLVFGRKTVGPDEISEAMEEFMTPLSERHERTVPEIFRDLPGAMIAGFINELVVRRYRDKQHIIEEGDSGDSMYVIRSGITRVVAHMLGRELELAILSEGDVFGEVGFLTGRPRTASVIADGAVEVYEISRLDIEKLIETNPEIIARIEEFYETRIRDTIRKIKG